MDTYFGEHITIDGYGGNQDLLNNRDYIFNILSELPIELGMHILLPPHLVLAPDLGVKDPGGFSGFVVIAESHISIHTFPKRSFVSADIYTCKNGMDVEKVKNYFKKKFNLQDLEVNFIKRGLKYPDHNIN